MKDLKLAVLIDADNVPSHSVKAMLEEISKNGTPTIKRIYADWTKPHVASWKPSLLENAITPIQQYSYTTGKNSSDSALIIDAMDILYGGRVDGFCIVSSDSDFTRLAIRLREAGMVVLGFGERKTPTPFITACDKFIYIEILKQPVTQLQKAQTNAIDQPKQLPPLEVAPIDDALINLLADSVDDLADESGWTFLGRLGAHLSKIKTDFDARNYGFTKLLQLIQKLDIFDIDQRESDGGNANVRLIYVRRKQA
jgi:uncharacterized LabA/DUF88 family protein/Fe-S-cluster formation regulator IscX/YfhJ